MGSALIFGLLALIMLGVGVFMGKKMAVLKTTTAAKDLENRWASAQIQLEGAEKRLRETKEEHRAQIEKTEMDFHAQLDEAKNEREQFRREKENLTNELTRRNTEFENLQQKNNEQKAEVEKLQEKFQKEFENLANKILDQKSKKFTNLNKENIQHILSPLQEKIKGFEEKVEKSQHDSLRRHAELGKQLQYLNEQNIKISEEATNLTKALKGNTKMQGNWGEMVLERVLERSGLQKDSEYFVQQSFTTTENKRVMPDVIIALPGDKKMIIDSKVSLVAYERYINSTEKQEKEQHLKQHLSAVRKRVDELGRKKYHQIYHMESPDFVLLFIPIESAFALASNDYPNLYGEAFDKNIIIVTPTTLLAVLKTIDTMWQNEKQKQNAIEIATQAGALYDSFTNLTNELLKVGRQIGTVQNSYESAMKKLTGKGNLIRRVERLKKLGAKADKQIDQNLVKRAQNTEETKDL